MAGLPGQREQPSLLLRAHAGLHPGHPGVSDSLSAGPPEALLANECVRPPHPPLICFTRQIDRSRIARRAKSHQGGKSRAACPVPGMENPSDMSFDWALPRLLRRVGARSASWNHAEGPKSSSLTRFSTAGWSTPPKTGGQWRKVLAPPSSRQRRPAGRRDHRPR